MSCTVTEESLDNLSSLWADSKHNLNWSSVFVLPGWLKVWWQVFGSEAELFIRGVGRDESIMGLAPLMVDKGMASLIGSTDVCDYLDFIVAPGGEGDFFTTLLDYWKRNDIEHLDLKHLRPDSTVMTHLVPIAESHGCDVSCHQEEISLEMDLPPTWEEYLATLNGKQRHEVRRKLRRLSEAGKVDYSFIDDSAAVPGGMDIFFRMFTESRQDKAAFLTEQRESFFRRLADTMAEVGLLRLGVLELDRQPVAAIMCFDYRDCVYLYNSGYDPEYNYLSVGLLSKVLCIQDGIQRGRKRFDFLKGAEEYKYHLGGREVPLYRCRIDII